MNPHATNHRNTRRVPIGNGPQEFFLLLGLAAALVLFVVLGVDAAGVLPDSHHETPRMMNTAEKKTVSRSAVEYAAGA